MLIAWAPEDRFFPLEHARRLAELLPDARVEEVPDSYTYVCEDQPERTADSSANSRRVRRKALKPPGSLEAWPASTTRSTSTGATGSAASRCSSSAARRAADDGHVNVSPKGPGGTLRVLDDRTVAYLDVIGSGAETIAHICARTAASW